MGVKESVSNAIMDKRTLIVILVIAILWRLGIRELPDINLPKTEMTLVKSYQYL